ncbi:MAG: flagellar biosynthesis protein FlhF [Polaromonas sp.]|uniref:flagellar biosynthesis protein FlhF n=1 Tax=Polaromonas sp. TaxID=1869339 RepID=UPI002486F501|nr:flagellar biosynthesis protein FlhF [Polaromonas sp.]MDI1268223.1 flagellar biosynthesis protein FlhF [Polaromonas sp.]
MTTHLTPGTPNYHFTAPSSREALRLVRETLGPDAMVLSNRVTAGGIEIVATLEEPVARVTAPATPPTAPSPPPADPSPAAQPAPGPTTANEGDSVLREIHSMRGMIEEQLASMAWNEKQRRDPVRGHLLRTLLGAGFSARLAKEILENLPTGQPYACGMDYAKAELARQMLVIEDEDALMDAGGVYALMGPTGVGKTTTTAKLAARCVMRFGPEKLALVTTDSYRIGAYEQLRIYGQILGVSVHAVKDAADLERVLGDLRDKHMVLIDTVGMSQRDRAVSDQIAMLCGASRPVKRLLLLNASSHGDTLNEVVQAYRHSEQRAGSTNLAGCIFTKVDEATHPGVLIDMAIRHQLPVHYISNGQKVPEHLMLVDRMALVDSVFQAKSPSALFVPGEADLDERPAPLSNEAEVAAAEAVSERLRSQCQQLIRALTHNAQELASNASALANGQIGFEETRALWRQLCDDRVGVETVAQTQRSQASADIHAGCSDYVLAVAGETSLAWEDGDDSRVLGSTLLLSDRTGRPFAAPQQLLASSAQPGMSQAGDWAQKFGKPVVHLFARIPASGLINQWQSGGLQWAASGTAALRIMDAGNGAPGTLAKLAAGLTFSAPKPITYRRKPALISVAEALVVLRPDPRDGAVGIAAASSTLRCVVRRIVDADSGKSLAHSYVLVSIGVQATAQQMAQWPGWRAAAEPYFKLLKQGILQLGGAGPSDEAAMRKRLLIAGQACTTVFRLQYVQDAWADAARKVLAQLAGRSVRPDRPVPGPVLLEGLGKLFVLLDALETDGAAPSPQPHRVTARV